MQVEAIQSMPFEAYAAAPGINATAIKAGVQSMKNMHYSMEQHDNEPSACMRLGSVAHTLILEPEQEPLLTVMPKFSGTGMRAAKAEWLEDHPDAVIFKQAEFDAGRAMRDAVMAEPEAARIIEATQHEVSIFWSDRQAGARKARLDCFSPDVGIGELKTTGKIEPRRFANMVKWDGYGLQVGTYWDAAKAALDGGGCPVNIIAVGSKAPYECYVVHFKEDTIKEYAEKAYDIARAYRVSEVLGRFDGIVPEGVIQFEDIETGSGAWIPEETTTKGDGI